MLYVKADEKQLTLSFIGMSLTCIAGRESLSFKVPLLEGSAGDSKQPVGVPQLCGPQLPNSASEYVDKKSGCSEARVTGSRLWRSSGCSVFIGRLIGYPGTTVLQQWVKVALLH